MPVAPAEVRRIARRALADRDRYGRGGTAVGVARARDIENGRNLSRETLERMVSFFARHATFARNRRDPTSAASISWRLWGGSAGRDWAKAELRKMERE